jgi:DNA-3-methyladenine glycosylase II
VSGRRLFYMSDDAVVEAVTQIRGIGEWTAHMLLMFSLGRPDVLPVGDYGVRKGMQQIYGLAELPRPAEMERIALPWRPYRSVASWYLWRHLDPVAGGG